MKLDKILLVDDDEDMCNAVSLAITREEIALVTCHGGNEALEEIDKSEPDLALIDVLMPGMDGVALFEKILAKGYKFPVIFMTVKASAEDIHQYHKLGAAGVIPKPFDPSSLYERIREIYSEQ